MKMKYEGFKAIDKKTLSNNDFKKNNKIRVKFSKPELSSAITSASRISVSRGNSFVYVAPTKYGWKIFEDHLQVYKCKKFIEVVGRSFVLYEKTQANEESEDDENPVGDMVTYRNFFEELLENTEYEVTSLRNRIEKLGVKTGLRYDPRGFLRPGHIIATQKGKGLGTKAMNMIIQYSEENRIPILIEPSSEFGGDLNRLYKFYEKFGFKRQRSGNKMYRIPN